MTDKAASPGLTVRDVFYNVIGRPENETDDVCETLGIDPDMPVETLMRRLLWGERVEYVHDNLDAPGFSSFPRSFGALGLERWLTRTDNTEPSVRVNCEPHHWVDGYCQLCGRENTETPTP